MKKYKLNLYLPLFGAVFVMFIITVVSFIYFQENAIHENKRNVVGKFFNELEIKSQYDTEVFSSLIDMVDVDESIIHSYELRDKKGLYDLIKPLYEKLNRDIDLTHFYFILNDGTVFLRVHNYEKDGDTIKRTTFLKAQKEDALSSGLEFGILRNYTLRVVKPWIVHGKKIGYIELGKEINKTMRDLSKLLDTHIYIAVKKDIYAHVIKSVKERLG